MEKQKPGKLNLTLHSFLMSIAICRERNSMKAFLPLDVPFTEYVSGWI